MLVFYQNHTFLINTIIVFYVLWILSIVYQLTIKKKQSICTLEKNKKEIRKLLAQMTKCKKRILRHLIENNKIEKAFEQIKKENND